MSWNEQIIEEFRTRRGRPGGVFEGVPILLLHNTGARTGAARINPLVYAKDGATFVVAASKGGAASHPDWYHNVMAHPDVVLEVGTERFPARATIHDEGPERDRLYPLLESTFHVFTEYKTKTDRVIPVIALDRTE